MSKRSLEWLVYGGLTIFVLVVAFWFHNRSNLSTNDRQPLAPRSLDISMADYEKKITMNPKEISNYINLAGLYVQKVRETADVVYYKKIDELMVEALEIDPKNADVFATQATVALGRHHFADGLELGKKAHELKPDRALYYGIMGDAYLELGQYDAAADSFQTMVDLRPDFGSYSRIAYIRELYGDIEGAKEALQLAISAGSAFKENVAWAYNELGKLETRASLIRAKRTFATALQVLPEYAPALEGLGKVAFFNNDYKTAEDYFSQAFKVLPIAQYAIDLGDLYLIKGDKIKADQQFFLAKIAFDKSAASGVNTDMEYAVFLADQELDLDLALQKAEAASRERPSIYGGDSLAWVLFKKGDYAKAWQSEEDFLKKIPAEVVENEPLVLWHRGMMAEKVGQADKANEYFKRALEVNPHFSMRYAGEAKKGK